jgi:hypothetical protein
LKNKKVEFQNTRTTLTSFGIHEICQKSGHGVEWVSLNPTHNCIFRESFFHFYQFWLFWLYQQQIKNDAAPCTRTEFRGSPKFAEQKVQGKNSKK